MKNQSTQLKEETRKLEHIAKQLGAKVEKDLKNAKAELRASALEDDANGNTGSNSAKLSPALAQMLLEKPD